MNAKLPRITARVDIETQELLLKASALIGISSINSFVLNAAIEKAKKIIKEESQLKLSYDDAMLFVEALDKPMVNLRLKKAMSNYKRER